jgi:hypothetical protein
MAVIHRRTEPRPSLLIALYLFGAALAQVTQRGTWANALSGILADVSIGWLIARAWYLRNEPSASASSGERVASNHGPAS